MKYSGLMLFTLVATVITDTLRLLSWVETVSMGYSTYISAFLNYLSLFVIAFVANKTAKYNEIPSTTKYFFNLWILWNIFNIFRGAFLANDYWDWKFLLLSSLGFSLISLVFFVGNNPLFTKRIFYFYLKYIFIFGFIIIPLTLTTNQELYSRLMIPVSFFILFIPYLQFRWKPLIVIVAATSILLSIGFRTNLLKITISVLLLSLFFFRRFIMHSWIRLAHFILFFGPIVLLVLGLNGSFNLFSELSTKHEYIITDNQGKKQNLTGDTRSFLYKEVLESMDNISSWLIGKSASGSYNSKWFYNTGGAMGGIRYGTEINILNILLYHGIIGVIIYFLLLYKISYRAINNSSNILSKMLGLVIASRWTLSFVEEFTQYDLNFFFFWLIMGLVSTSFFRQLDDEEIRDYFKLS